MKPEKIFLSYPKAKEAAIKLSKMYGTIVFVMKSEEPDSNDMQHYACLPGYAHNFKDKVVLQVGPKDYKSTEEKTPGIPEVLTAIEKLTADIAKKHYATIKIAPDELIQRAYDAIVLLLENEDLSPEANRQIDWVLIRQTEKDLLSTLRALKK